MVSLDDPVVIALLLVEALRTIESTVSKSVADPTLIPALRITRKLPDDIPGVAHRTEDCENHAVLSHAVL